MDTFETAVGYRSLAPALCLPEKQAIERLSEEELVQLVKDSFDASLAETLRSSGEWHWKLEIREVVEEVAEMLSFGKHISYERLRVALLNHYTEQYRRPTVQEYRTYLREKKAQKLSIPQEPIVSQKGEVPYGPACEEEQARFEVTYTAHSLYSTEITTSTLEELRAKVEVIYDETDLDRFAFDSHDEEWKPLNAAARRLLEEAQEGETHHSLQETNGNNQYPSLFARVFTTIWGDPKLTEILLANVKHELSRMSSRMDIADVVLMVLEENVPALHDVDLRENLEIDPLIEFLVAYVGKVPLDPEYLEQNGSDPKLLEPTVTASCHSDDHVVEVKHFDATLFFAQASDEELELLGDEGYGGGYAADSVAEFMAAYNREVQAMFDHNEGLPRSVELRGFECYVNEEEAEAWIAQHRPHLLAEKEEEENNE